MKAKEILTIKNGKMVFALCLESTKGRSEGNHIYMENGKTYFCESFYHGKVEFDIGNESHRLAKEIFLTELQADIKRKVLELKELEAIFSEIGVAEYFAVAAESTYKMITDKLLIEEVPTMKKKIKAGVKFKATRAGE